MSILQKINRINDLYVTKKYNFLCNKKKRNIVIKNTFNHKLHKLREKSIGQ
jgi:hypothetical protein